MRVLVVITKGELGGAQTHVAELCGALRERCEFLVLVGGALESPLRDALTVQNIRVEALPGLSNAVRARALLTTVRQVAARARSWQADVIHVHSAMAAAVGRLAGCIASVPVVYTVHGFAFKPQVPMLRRLGALWGERLLAPFTRRLICVSAAERQLASRLGIPAPRIEVVPNGISDSGLRACPSSGPPTLVMVARMAAPKRHDLLLDALRILAARGTTPPRTLLAGGGPFLAGLKQHAADSRLQGVEFLGDTPQVAQTLARSHVFVLLSDHEGQPISVIEAMRAGLPVLASRLPGIAEQVTHGVEGLLTGNTPDEIADSLQRLIQRPELRASMGAAARLRYEREFSAISMASRVAGVYAGAAATRGVTGQEAGSA